MTIIQRTYMYTIHGEFVVYCEYNQYFLIFHFDPEKPPTGKFFRNMFLIANVAWIRARQTNR